MRKLATSEAALATVQSASDAAMREAEAAAAKGDDLQSRLEAMTQKAAEQAAAAEERQGEKGQQPSCMAGVGVGWEGQGERCAGDA